MHPTEPRHARRPGAYEKSTKRRTTVELTPCGPFRLGEVIGHSATSTVFMATRSGAKAEEAGPFAVKKLTGDARDGSIPREQVEAFVREIRLMRRVQHRAVVTVVDMAAAPSEDPYLVMELLDGLPLDRVGRRLQRVQDKMSSALAAFIAREIADGLSHVHNLRDEQGRPLGVVHGGLRPKEIVLLRSGEPKLLAFGPGNTGTLATTGHRRRHQPATYRAPEQILGRPIDARTDLFSLGAILWELLVGPPLFSGGTEEEAVAAVLTREIPHPSSLRKGIPARLDAIVMRALQRDPRRRYPNAEAMVADLERGLRTRKKLVDHGADLITDLTGLTREDSLPMSAGDRTTRSADFSSSTTAVRRPPGQTPTPTPVDFSSSAETRADHAPTSRGTPQPLRLSTAPSRVTPSPRSTRPSQAMTPRPRRTPGMPPPVPRSARHEEAPRRERTRERKALSGYIEGPNTPVHPEPTPEELITVSIPVTLTPTANLPIVERRPTPLQLGLGPLPPRPSSLDRPTALIPARHSLGPWYVKVAAAALLGAIAGAVFHGRGPWREHANAAPAGPQNRPEIMAISGADPGGESAAAIPVAAAAPAPAAPEPVPATQPSNVVSTTAAAVAPARAKPGAYHRVKPHKATHRRRH